MAFLYDNKDGYSSNQDYKYLLNSKCGTKTDSTFFYESTEIMGLGFLIS